jgi:hypothetical protein
MSVPEAMYRWPEATLCAPEATSRLARDPLGAGILLAAASELACATLIHTGAAREIPVSRGVVAASLLASAGQPSWRVPALANASLQHFVRAGRLGRVVDVVWAAALGALLREARRAERWDG